MYLTEYKSLQLTNNLSHSVQFIQSSRKFQLGWSKVLTGKRRYEAWDTAGTAKLSTTKLIYSSL